MSSVSVQSIRDAVEEERGVNVCALGAYTIIDSKDREMGFYKLDLILIRL